MVQNPHFVNAVEFGAIAGDSSTSSPAAPSPASQSHQQHSPRSRLGEGQLDVRASPQKIVLVARSNGSHRPLSVRTYSATSWPRRRTNMHYRTSRQLV